MGKLYGEVEAKGNTVTYNFENFEIDVPKAGGPGGRDLISVKETINGKLTITVKGKSVTEEATQDNQVSLLG
jgi:hypothetical protein